MKFWPFSDFLGLERPVPRPFSDLGLKGPNDPSKKVNEDSKILKTTLTPNKNGSRGIKVGVRML